MSGCLCFTSEASIQSIFFFFVCVSNHTILHDIDCNILLFKAELIFEHRDSRFSLTTVSMYLYRRSEAPPLRRPGHPTLIRLLNVASGGRVQLRHHGDGDMFISGFNRGKSHVDRISLVTRDENVSGHAD